MSGDLILQLDAAVEVDAARYGKLRRAVAERLCEVVAWPQSRISAQERQLAGDVLVGLLAATPKEVRQRCAARMQNVTDAPKALLRYLAQDDVAVAAPLLERSPSLDDSDLCATIAATGPAHAAIIAGRRGLGEMVSEAIARAGHAEAIERLLANPHARISSVALDVLVRRSRERPSFAPLLLRRDELKPAQGLTLFWWADHEARRLILRRFAVDREVLLHELSDLLVAAADDGWRDPEVRKALQFIERRQRSRAAAARSPHGTLEAAVALAADQGMDRELSTEISHLAGLRPRVGAHIFADPGGEAIAVLCKACGLKRDHLAALWTALRRGGHLEEPASPLGRVALVFDSLAVAKAQTVLRYWNWCLTSDGSDAADLDDPALDYLPARRAAALVRNWP